MHRWKSCESRIGRLLLRSVVVRRGEGVQETVGHFDQLHTDPVDVARLNADLVQATDDTWWERDFDDDGLISRAVGHIFTTGDQVLQMTTRGQGCPSDGGHQRVT